VRSLEVFVVTNAGMARVRNLVALHERLARNKAVTGAAPAADVLRAAVVLLHAVTEEFIRYVAARALPHGNDAALRDIPLIGVAGPSVKFGLDSLARHRGKVVDVVIADAVAASLRERSFSSLDAILGVLTACGIPTRRLRFKRAAVSQLVRRRHRIVHEADVPMTRPQHRRGVPRPISPAQVARWITAVDRFIGEVDKNWNVGRWA